MADRLTPPLGPDDHVDGPADAPLELVMYGDFQCPYCSAAQPILRRVRDRLDGRLRFVFRHFPLPEIHPDAQRAAEASEVAAAQGAFWPMHDALYGARGQLGLDQVIALAERLGLDAARMRSELAERERTRRRVARDVECGSAGGVGGTPTFFVGGVRHEGAFDAQSLIAALEARRIAELRDQLGAERAAVDRDRPAGELDAQGRVHADLELAAVERDRHGRGAAAQHERDRRAARSRAGGLRLPHPALEDARADRVRAGVAPERDVRAVREARVVLDRRADRGKLERYELLEARDPDRALRVADRDVLEREAGDLAGAVLASAREVLRAQPRAGPCPPGRSPGPGSSAGSRPRPSGSRTRPGRSRPSGAGT